MGIYKNKAYPLRIDINIMEKLKVIAKENGRTTNKQIESVLKEYLKDYEENHGEISPDQYL